MPPSGYIRQSYLEVAGCFSAYSRHYNIRGYPNTHPSPPSSRAQDLSQTNISSLLQAMPLPDEALRIEGGCNCNAIRYCVDIPTRDERPLHPLAPTEAPVPMPFLALDHCNDCRRATASILPAWLCAPLDMCCVSLVASSSATLAPKAAAREGQAKEQGGPWTPAADVFTPTAASSGDSFLTSYESSHERWRWFCGRCGTNVAYTAAMAGDISWLHCYNTQSWLVISIGYTATILGLSGWLC